MKEVSLPSGAVLKILTIPFAEAKALYQSVLEELRSVKMEKDGDMINLIKEMGYIGFASKKVEVALTICLGRCTYNDLKIDAGTFEPEVARQDYSMVCREVIENAISPFSKNLFVESSLLAAVVFGSPK